MKRIATPLYVNITKEKKSDPDQWKDDVKGRFWYGEMMFCKNHVDIEHWRQYAEKVMKSLSKDKKELAQKLQHISLVWYFISRHSSVNGVLMMI